MGVGGSGRSSKMVMREKKNGHERRGYQRNKIPDYYKDYHAKTLKSLRMTAEIRVG